MPANFLSKKWHSGGKLAYTQKACTVLGHIKKTKYSKQYCSVSQNSKDDLDCSRWSLFIALLLLGAVIAEEQEDDNDAAVEEEDDEDEVPLDREVKICLHHRIAHSKLMERNSIMPRNLTDLTIKLAKM